MDKKLNLALVQSSIHWENPKANRITFTEKIAHISDNADLIILPEMFTTGFTMHPKNIDTSEEDITVMWMQQIASEKDAAVIGSIIFRENESCYNRLFFVEPDGKVSRYDKRHTFTLAGEHEVYEAGIEKLIIEFRNFKICPLICYDLRFPVWSRNVDGYDVLIYVANWPMPRINAWDTLLKARAIENMAYTVGVNRIGIDQVGHEYPGHSGVYDVLGNELAFSDQEEVFYATLSKEEIISYRVKLMFLEDADEFNLI